MADITITQPELDCICGRYQRAEINGNIVECPDCGRIYQIVCYLLEVDKYGNYLSGENEENKE